MRRSIANLEVTRPTFRLPGAPGSPTPPPGWAATGPALAGGSPAGSRVASPSGVVAEVCADSATRDEVAVRGRHIGTYDTLDSFVKEYMTSERIPNASLAVIAPDGRLVLARGYTLCTAFPRGGGVADWADGSRGFELFYAKPTSQFRIGSISKTLTAATILSMNEDKLFANGLDTPIVDIMGADFFQTTRLRGAPGREYDQYREETTLRHLLRHLTPWCERDEDGNFDEARTSGLLVTTSPYCHPNWNPLRRDAEIVELLRGKLRIPISRDDIRHMMNLYASSFAPGTVYSYSNYGYMLLGQVVEKVAGTSYRAAVSERVLRPLKMTRTTLGATLHAERQRGEVEYFDRFGRPRNSEPDSDTDGYSRSVVRSGRERAYDPYGGLFNLENGAAAGGWTSTVVDLLRLFRNLLEAKRGVPALLTQTTVDDMMLPSSDYLDGLGIRNVGSESYGMGLYRSRNIGSGVLTDGFFVGGTMPSGGTSNLRMMAPDSSGNQWGFAFLQNRTANENEIFRYNINELLDDLIAEIPLCTDPGIGDLFNYYR